MEFDNENSRCVSARLDAAKAAWDKTHPPA